MVQVKKVRNGKATTYMLNKEEFRAYMFNMWKSAQARKQAKEDIRAERQKERENATQA